MASASKSLSREKTIFAPSVQIAVEVDPQLLSKVAQILIQVGAKFVGCYRPDYRTSMAIFQLRPP